MLSMSQLQGFNAGGEHDPYWDDVVLLMHMDGANGSTSFTDLKGHTFTRDGPSVADGVYISTAQSKFGGSSAYFNGQSALLTADSTDWILGDASTIEMFIRPGTLGGVLIAQWNINADFAFYLMLTSGGELTYAEANTGANTTSGAGIATNNWYHVAMCQSGTSAKIFVNGVNKKSFSLPATGANSAQQLTIGCFLSSGPIPSNIYDGYIDELRITKGVSRYTTDFTPPTAPFPNY